MCMESENRVVAVVTGANRGIGFEVCRQLSQLNITTILTSRDEDKGKRAADDLKSSGAEVIFHQLDVADPASINRFKEFVSDNFKRCDILVNNAGVFIDRGVSILELPEEMLMETLEINFLGALRMCQAFLPMMQDQGYGRVVNVSSSMGSISRMGAASAAYKLSKLLVNGMTRIISAEVKQENIKINTMSPGWVRSDMGGPNALKTLAEGADTIIWLATLPENGSSGGFFEERSKASW